MAIRFIALDIDGTLLNNAFEVPLANRLAIEAAVARGIEVALVTGRRFDFALPVARGISSPLTMIVNNGALVKSSRDGVTHLRRLLPREVARMALRLLPEFREGAAVVFDRPRADQVIFECIDWDDPRRGEYFQRNREFLAQVAPLEDCLTEDPIQVMYSGPVATMRRVDAVLCAAAKEAGFSVATTFYETPRDFGLVDVIRQNCSKGATLAEWTALRGFARHEVMAIGDNLNDLEMLEFAGLPVVMGNGVSELKTFGWRQTLSNDDAGVAAAIAEYALEP